MPQVIAVDGMGDKAVLPGSALLMVSRTGAPQGSPPTRLVSHQRQQAAEVVLMQAGAASCTSTTSPGNARRPASTESARARRRHPPRYLRMLCQRQLAEAAIAGADGNHHQAGRAHPPQRGDRVFENRLLPIERYVSGIPFACGNETGRRHHGKRPKSGCYVVTWPAIDCSVVALMPDWCLDASGTRR